MYIPPKKRKREKLINSKDIKDLILTITTIFIPKSLSRNEQILSR